MAEQVLVVDDEKEIADLIEVYLENEGFEVRTFYDPQEALASLEKKPPDLAILDVMMPKLDGFTLCRKIREQYHYPIIMLTAREEEVDKIMGLTLGADDYITKPFRPLELVARVKAQMRRYHRYNTPVEKEENVIVHSGLVLDIDNHLCTLNEKVLNLTPTEFSILTILCRKKGSVVSAEELFRSIWDDEYYNKNNNTITVHIRHLREKMGDNAENPKYIKTVWGCGYKIEK